MYIIKNADGKLLCMGEDGGCWSSEKYPETFNDKQKALDIINFKVWDFSVSNAIQPRAMYEIIEIDFAGNAEEKQKASEEAR